MQRDIYDECRGRSGEKMGSGGGAADEDCETAGGCSFAILTRFDEGVTTEWRGRQGEGARR